MLIPKSSLRHCIVLLFSILIYPWHAVAQMTSVGGRITQAVDEKNLVSLPGNVHPLARPEFDQGPIADAQPLRRMLLLLRRNPEQETALRSLLSEQQDQSSPNYHAWLTPEQFGRQFGPAESDVQTLTQWLTTQGFTDIKVGPGRTVIEFSGNVGSVRNAFHTEIHRYLVKGEEHIANASAPLIPAALKPVIAGIVSLHNFRKRPMYHLAPSFSTKHGPFTSARPDLTNSSFDGLTGTPPTCHPLAPYTFA